MIVIGSRRILSLDCIPSCWWPSEFGNDFYKNYVYNFCFSIKQNGDNVRVRENIVFKNSAIDYLSKF